jgi:hypothetical protein
VVYTMINQYVYTIRYTVTMPVVYTLDIYSDIRTVYGQYRTMACIMWYIPYRIYLCIYHTIYTMQYTMVYTML